MLIENMKMAFSAIRSNKMRSALTMLGIIIGIGSVIAIVSIGDTMRGLFSDLYKDVGITQAYISIGYWVDDVWQSDYFTLDEMERAKEAFKDQVAYIDSSAYTSSDAEYKRTKIKFDYQGIDYNYQDVQPVNVVYGRYLNEGDILGRRKNVVMDTKSAQMLFGTENAVGRSFRTTLYGSTDDFTVVGVYRKEVNAFQALMMGNSDDKGSAFIPYTLLTWPNDYFYQLHVYAKDDVNLDQFFSQFKAYAAKMHGRQPEDMYMYTAMQEMTSVDSMMGSLSMAVGGIAAISLMVGGIGTEAIAAVGLVGQSRMLMLCMFFAMNTGITAVVARRKGQGDREDANRTLRTSLLIIFLMSLVMTVVGQLVARPLMRLAGAKADTIDDAEIYFRIVTAVLPFNALSMAMCAAQRGIGNTRITLYVNVTSNVVNVFLNWLLINGIWIFPRWEVKGAAIATAIGLCVGLVLACISLVRRHEGDMGFLRLSVKDDWRFSLPAARAVVKVGGNSMLEQIALRIGFFLYARLVADLGTQAYASHVVCMQFLNLSFTFADGIGVASTSLVGQMLGRERPDLSHLYGKIAQRIAVVGAVLLASVIVIFRYPLVGLFTDDPTVARLSANVMLIVALFQPLQMLSVITSGALRGAGDTKFVARVMLICVAIIRPVLAFSAIKLITQFFTPVYAEAAFAGAAATLTYWLAYEAPEWALLGAWAASLVDMALRMGLVMKRFNGGKWHSIKV